MEEAATLRRTFGVPLLYRGVGAEGPEGLDAALSLTEGVGAASVIWQDGFGGPMALRDEAGVPGPSWETGARRPWPTRIAGSILSFGRGPEGFALRWWHDGSNQGVSRVGARGLGAVSDVVYVEGGEGAPIWAYDPSVKEVTLVVDGPPRVVEVMMSGDP